MFYTDDDYNDIMRQHRCTCRGGFGWEQGPCDTCNGDYDCEGGCGHYANDCQCEAEDEA